MNSNLEELIAFLFFIGGFVCIFFGLWLTLLVHNPLPFLFLSILGIYVYSFSMNGYGGPGG